MRHTDRDVVLEDLTFLADTGVGYTEAARRTGFTSAHSLDKYLRRHRQTELIGRLMRHEYWPTKGAPRRKAC